MDGMLVQVTLASVILLVGLNYYVYHGFGRQPNILRRLNGKPKKVVLTFDDGPDPRYTPYILDILRAHGVKAVFFLVGKAVARYPEIAQRIVREGHEIGNHTYSHRNLTPGSYYTVERELRKAQRIITVATGVAPRYFRPPRGMYSDTAIKVAKHLCMETVLWTLSSEDWMPEVTPHRIARRIVRKVSNGCILLFHDGGNLMKYEGGDREATLHALPIILTHLKRQGYEFITLSDYFQPPATHPTSAGSPASHNYSYRS